MILTAIIVTSKSAVLHPHGTFYSSIRKRQFVKHNAIFFVVLLALSSCEKTIDSSSGSISGEIKESQNGVFLLPCHSTSFTTNYIVQPGKAPPFRFTKTHYPSGRVRAINMLSRANPNHPAFKPQAWELIGTFTYDGKNKAYFNGTKQLWEYYKSSTGTAGKKSVIKKNVSLTFYFHDDPYVVDNYGSCYNVYNNLERADALWVFDVRGGLVVERGSDEPESTFIADISEFPNKMTMRSWPLSGAAPRRSVTFTYATKPEKTLSYQPTQNWISLEYNLLEVMQWLPQTYMTWAERTKVDVEFYPYNNSYKVVQSQFYKNHKYDSKGNLLSYTYGDNVLQKTAWLCK